jgi:hypothetical protein
MVGLVIFNLLIGVWIVVTIMRIRSQRKFYNSAMAVLNTAVDDIMLHKEALTWAVGTGQLPPTCPGHFMHLLIEAKEKADKLNGA